jgi:hypothetical protein
MKKSFKQYLMERKLNEVDASDVAWSNEIRQKQADKVADERPRKDFEQRVKQRTGGVSVGDRIYNPKTKKMYTVGKVTADGVYIKGGSRPIKLQLKDTGRTTELGHRVFVPA